VSTAYCTLADLEAAVTTRRLIEATNDDDPTATGSIDQGKVDAAIAAAGDLIDGYLGKRYPLPLPSIPTLVTRLAVDLAVRNLFARVQDGEMSQGVRDRGKESVRTLELIMRGEISLGLPVTAAAPMPVGPMINQQRQLFSERRLDRMDDDISRKVWA
jgi:phage gp36-like protein